MTENGSFFEIGGDNHNRYIKPAKKRNQDDAEGRRRDWEEDPLGFDTNPTLLRAMCMALE